MNQFIAKHFADVVRLVSCVMALVAGAMSEAAVVGKLTLMRDPSLGLPFTSPDVALPDSWVSYALTVSTTGDDRIQAVDVNINGQLHQRWNDPEGGGAYTASGNSTNKSNGDSHFLASPAMLFAVGPTEDNPATGSPLSGGNSDSTIAGVGANLAGVFGPPGFPVTYLEVAYLVIPKGTENLLDIDIDVLNPTGDIIGQIGCCSFPFPPSTRPASAQVKGNNLVINRDDATPRAEDNTDFGLDPVGVAEIRTFILENTGTVPLSLGVPTFTGPFSLASTFPSTINPGGNTSFNVRMTRDAPGNFLGSMSFASNSGPYAFALAGQAVPEPSAWLIGSLALASWGAVRCR